MSNEVYANNMEISCKSADGKSIAAFPDVCFTPPQTPATPPGVPIPYPNTGFSSDTTNGTRTVKITNKEVMLKNKSYFKTSYGDEAGCAPKKNVITSKIKGKVYFIAWSMNVKFEGENVVRHMDLTTHNHASQHGGTPPQMHVDGMSLPPSDPECQKLEATLVGEVRDLPAGRKRVYVDNVDGLDAEPSTLAVARSSASPGVTAGHSGVGPAQVVASRKVVRGGRYAAYAKGKKIGEPSSVKQCGGKEGSPTFQYKNNPSRPQQGHAEAKIIEEWYERSNGNPSGTLTLNVSRPCCEECAKLIRWANCGEDGKNCNKIKVCENHQDESSLNNLKC